MPDLTHSVASLATGRWVPHASTRREPQIVHHPPYSIVPPTRSLGPAYPCRMASVRDGPVLMGVRTAMSQTVTVAKHVHEDWRALPCAPVAHNPTSCTCWATRGHLGKGLPVPHQAIDGHTARLGLLHALSRRLTYCSMHGMSTSRRLLTHAHTLTISQRRNS